MERVAGGVFVAASGGAFVGHGAGTKMKAKNEWMRMIWPPTVKFASVRLYVKHEMLTAFQFERTCICATTTTEQQRQTMSSSKQEGAAAAAQELGSMTLGESVERKENETQPNAKNGTTPTKKFCSACGKESDALKKCKGCKCVWYCNKKCQNKHRKEHKHECQVIEREIDKRGGKLDVGTELDVGPLGKLPPREECPICMLALPPYVKLHRYFACCGNTICGGCQFQHQVKSREQSVPPTCAFCREPIPKTEEKELAQLRKRVELKDPEALCNVGMYHGRGYLGLSVDHAKCLELLRQSADLGYPPAHYQLGTFRHTGEMGLERNKEEALKYLKAAAEGGDMLARHFLGCEEGDNGDHVAAMRNFRLSASGGLKLSILPLIRGFEGGLLHHADLANTMSAYYRSKGEMRSNDRHLFIEHTLKKTGHYRPEYDM